MQPELRGAQRGQGRHQVLAHLVMQVAVDEDRVESLEQAAVRLGGDVLQVAQFQFEAVGLGDVRQLAEFARGNVAGGDEEQALGVRAGRGAEGEGQAQAQAQARQQPRAQAGPQARAQPPEGGLHRPAHHCVATRR